jgi:hypothetical protein
MGDSQPGEGVPEPEHGQSEMQYFSMSSNLSPTLACLKRSNQGSNQVFLTLHVLQWWCQASC